MNGKVEKTYTQHGGDIYTKGELNGSKIIDFSSNINFIGPPKCFYEAIRDAAGSITRYPDIEYRKLKASIRDYLKIDGAYQVLPGNGAAEIIDLIISCFESICIVVPSFSEYERCAHIHNCQVIYSYLKEDMTFNYEDVLEKLQQSQGLIIGNPNNPNGFIIDKSDFRKILDYSEKNNKTIIIDEAFIEFVGDDNASFLGECKTYNCLFIIRAVTKFFALPGVRLGYGITANMKLSEKIRNKQLPWTVNAFAEVSAEYIFKDKAYMDETIRANFIERDYFIKQLRKLSIFSEIYDGRANFLLCKLRAAASEKLFDYCLERGVLIRLCGNYRKLDDHFIRLAVKDRHSNERLIEVLSDIEKIKYKFERK